MGTVGSLLAGGGSVGVGRLAVCGGRGNAIRGLRAVVVAALHGGAVAHLRDAGGVDGSLRAENGRACVENELLFVRRRRGTLLRDRFCGNVDGLGLEHGVGVFLRLLLLVDPLQRLLEMRLLLRNGLGLRRGFGVLVLLLDRLELRLLLRLRGKAHLELLVEELVPALRPALGRRELAAHENRMRLACGLHRDETGVGVGAKRDVADRSEVREVRVEHRDVASLRKVGQGHRHGSLPSQGVQLRLLRLRDGLAHLFRIAFLGLRRDQLRLQRLVIAADAGELLRRIRSLMHVHRPTKINWDLR